MQQEYFLNFKNPYIVFYFFFSVIKFNKVNSLKQKKKIKWSTNEEIL